MPKTQDVLHCQEAQSWRHLRLESRFCPRPRLGHSFHNHKFQINFGYPPHHISQSALQERLNNLKIQWNQTACKQEKNNQEQQIVWKENWTRFVSFEAQIIVDSIRGGLEYKVNQHQMFTPTSSARSSFPILSPSRKS